MSDAAALRQRSPLVLADLLPGALVRDAILVVGAAGFVGLLAQISIHLSFTPVPITGQTLGVLLAGTALGWRRGGAAMVLYAVAGLRRRPVVRRASERLRGSLVRLRARLHRRRGPVRLPG